MSATDPVLAPDRGSEQAVYSSSISGPRPDEVAHIRELVDAAPPVPDPWEGVPAAEPIEGFDLEAQWQAIVGSPVPDISEVRSVRAVMVHGVARVEPLGPSSWMVTIGAFAEFVFREVATHRDLSADVTISTGGIHMLRTTSTLSLHGRTALARAAIARAGGVGGSEMWEDAVDQAVEAIMATVEALGDGVDLRFGEIDPLGPGHVAEPLWATGPTTMIMPGEAGKSTIARAMAVSITSGRLVVPGLYPRITGPVLYVASEDPGERSHRASIDAICAGAGIERRRLDHEIRLVPSRGQPLHRISRAIAEGARDYAGVIVDAQNGLLPTGDSGVRDGAATFWNAVDAIDRPVFVIAHPTSSRPATGRTPTAAQRALRSTVTGHDCPGWARAAMSAPRWAPTTGSSSCASPSATTARDRRTSRSGGRGRKEW